MAIQHGPKFNAPKLLGGIALSVSLPITAYALDLQEAYQLARTQDATVRAARQAAIAQRERLPQAGAQWLPNITFSAGRNRNQLERTQEGLPAVFDGYFSYNQTLTLRQPIFRKQLLSLIEQAEYAVSDANATQEREEKNLVIRVTGAYLEALLAQDQLELVNKQKATTTTQLDAARKLLFAGSGTRTDIDEAKARLDLALAQELEARQNLDYTRQQIASLVSQTVGDLKRVDAKKLPLSMIDIATLPDWLALAEKNSPEIQALKARREMARLELSKAEGGHYPTLDMVAQITRSGSENIQSPQTGYTNRLLGLQLNLPLYAGGYTSSVVRQAQAELAKAEEMQEATRRDLELRIWREYRNVTEGVLKIEAMRQAVYSAEIRVVSNRRSFEAGSRTLVDIFNAEQQLETARRDMAQTQYLYLLAWVKLHTLAGHPQDSVMTAINQVLEATKTSDK